MLYDSYFCRLCAEKNQSGTPLFELEDPESDLSELINKYLPIKVIDDGKLPKTICPGCNIQLDSTVQFFELIIHGQSILRTLYKKQVEVQKKSGGIVDEEDSTSLLKLEEGNCYAHDHGMSLRMEGLDRPRRKRGRPPKKAQASPASPDREAPLDHEMKVENIIRDEDPCITDGNSKRRRKVPLRYKETVQGKELERMFREEGVIDEESENDSPQANKNSDGGTNKEKNEEDIPDKDEIIGLVESTDGNTLGQYVIVNKGKGRGRPKGKVSSTKQICAVCNREFTSVGRYMAHVALHTNVTYECTECNEKYCTKLELLNHQEATTHKSQNITDWSNQKNMSPVKSSNDVKDSANIQTEEDDKAMEPDTTNAEMVSSDETSEGNIIKSLLENGESDNYSIDNQKQNKPENNGNKTREKRRDGKARFECSFENCFKAFYSKQSCDVHMKAAHYGQKPFICPQCNAKFPYQSSLKQHMMVHFKKCEKGYACDLCGKILNHPSSVIYHKIAEHNNGNRYVCIKCEKSFKHRQLLQRHQLVHSDKRPFECKVCGASFKTKANLTNHQPLHSGVKKFKCEICNHLFAHKTSLTLHMRWHSGYKPYQCKFCGKSFSQNGNLSEHIRTHTGDKPFVCTMCGRCFTTSSQHRLHVQRHRGEKPFKCDFCSKQFLGKETWEAHVRRHKGDRPHECPNCPRKFTERWALHKHLRSHTGERPYSCNVCERTFADCSNLVKHKKTHLESKVDKPATPPKPLQPNISPAIRPDNKVSGNDGQVIFYVQEYDNEYQEKDGAPIFQILDANKDDVGKIFTSFEQTESMILIGNDELKQPIVMNNIDQVIDNSGVVNDSSDIDKDEIIEDTAILTDEALPVTDQDGNTIHFNMPDGTPLPITSIDGGKSLQITTFDGQVIPVEISGGDFQIQQQIEQDDEPKSMNFQENVMDDQIDQSIEVMAPDGQTVRILPSFDENSFAQYFTIV